MYDTSVPLPPKKGVSVFFIFFDVRAETESNVKNMPKVVHAKLTIIEDILFLRMNPGASKLRPRALGEGYSFTKRFSGQKL